MPFISWLSALIGAYMLMLLTMALHVSRNQSEPFVAKVLLGAPLALLPANHPGTAIS